MEKSEQEELKTLIADYMEWGYLENILAMYRQDTELFHLTGDLLKDKRMRVRLGVAALIEELNRLRPREVQEAVPSLIKLLQEKDPTTRGDAAWLLGVIGGSEALESLRNAANDPDPQVAEAVAEALENAAERVYGPASDADN